MKIGNLTSNIVNNLNDVGRNTASAAKQARDFVARNVNKVTTNDEFVKLKNNVNKNTLVGGVVAIGAIVLAVKCIKGIIDKVSEYKK